MHVLIVGGGIAGVTAARTLRTLAPTARITILEAEPVLYYLRPGLIDLLAGRKGLADITPFPRGWYDRHGIVYRTGTPVVALDPARHRVTLTSGDEVSYDRLLLAAGAQALRPPIPGTDKPGVFTLRSAADAERIRTQAEGATAAAVIGGGWLGLEAARALRDRGLAVTVLERGPWLLPRQLDPDGAQVLAAILAQRGITLRIGVDCTGIYGDTTAAGVRLASGEEIPAELVLLAAGVRPRAALAAAAGLQVKGGIVVDDRLRTTAPDVYAAGDAAEWRGRSYGIIPAAREQAEVAARNMVEPGTATYTGTIPTNRLKVAGVDLVCLGDTQPQGGPGRELRRADPEHARYLKFVVDREGRLVGAILLGAPDLAAQVEAWIQDRAHAEGEIDRLLARPNGSPS